MQKYLYLYSDKSRYVLNLEFSDLNYNDYKEHYTTYNIYAQWKNIPETFQLIQINDYIPCGVIDNAYWENEKHDVKQYTHCLLFNINIQYIKNLINYILNTLK